MVNQVARALNVSLLLVSLSMLALIVYRMFVERHFYGSIDVLLVGAVLVMLWSAVRQLVRGSPVVPPPDPERLAALLRAGVSESVAACLAAGNKLGAIRLYREEHPGMGLKDAKDAIDRLLSSAPPPDQECPAARGSHSMANRVDRSLNVGLLITGAVVLAATLYRMFVEHHFYGAVDAGLVGAMLFTGGSAVNRLLRPSHASPPDPDRLAALVRAGVSDQVAACLAAGNKIGAIKLYREEHPGMGLKDAKDVVDRVGAS